MGSENKQFAAVKEAARISRSILVWLNTFPNVPVPLIKYEMLENKVVAMALAIESGAYITKRYITGGYRAEYPFRIIYRIVPGDSIDKRLEADELLNVMGSWAQASPPNLGSGIRVISVRQTAPASIAARYTDGDEDHEVSITITYEVI